MKYFLAVLGSIIFSLPLQTIAEDYNLGLPFIRYYSSREYNGGIQNYAFAQNRHGLIYVANNLGALEYDGSVWRRNQSSNGAKIRHVAIDEGGKIYVAGQGDFGYFFPDETGALVFTSLADSLPADLRNFDETWRVFPEENRVLFCTFRQIFIFDKKGELINVIKPGADPDNFFYVNHRLYVNQVETGLSYLDGDSLRRLPGSEDMRGMSITSIINLPNDQLWISTFRNGIYLYDGGGIQRWAGDNDSEFEQAYINCAERLRNGSYVLGTQNNGLYLLSPSGDILLHLNKTKGLNNRTVLSLFEDAQNNLWVGHNNGITYIELGIPFTYINEQVGLPGTGYAGLLDGNRIYLGTNNGLYVKKTSDPSYIDYKLIKNTEGQVYSVNKINGHLLVGHHNGAFEIVGDEARRLSDRIGAWTFLKVNNRPGYIIEGGYYGLSLYKEVDGRIQFQHKIAGFEESSRVMEQDANGDIWMTHGYKGVYRLTLNDKMDSVTNVRFYGAEDGLPSNLLINVFRIRDRLLFTTQNQIYRFDRSSQRFVLDEWFKDFFANNPVNALTEDPFQNIYYISLNEIGALEKNAGGGYSDNSGAFNKLKEMLNDDLQNITILRANQALYGAQEGFILYNAEQAGPADYPFTILIRQARLTGDNNEVIFNGHFTDNQRIIANQPPRQVKYLPYKNNSLQISYSATYMDGLGKTEYQYWLENSEKTWSEWTAKTEKEYTNLREGTYKFHVRARNIYGRVSPAATYSFVVNPPWYRTNLAYFAMAFSIAGGLFGSFYWFDKKHKKEKRIMSLQQRKELYKKETEIESIARQSADEIQRLKNENLKAEIESKNKELATSTMHLINKNGFIAQVKSSLAAIARRSHNKEVQHELKKVIGNIDKNISQDDDWEHFSFHFDQVHGDFMNRLKDAYPTLSPQEMKLSAYLRMNLSTKEVAHLLNISVRGVEICRYRLRKKLNLSRGENLQEFILRF